MSSLKDLTGQRFGRRTVIGRAGSDRRGCATWLCLCDCGNESVVTGAELRKNRSGSCGCMRKERLTIHGKKKTRLYKVWEGIKTRCYNPSHKAYERYGGRGITVCDEWLHDFQVFFNWAVANGYDEHAPRGQCTIDRIDNDRGYSPDNCRWVDAKTQNNNRSNSRPRKNRRSEL